METAKSTISLKWIESTLMTAIDSGGRPLVIGSSPGNGQEWRGLKASDLLLISAAACSTYDVVTILQKQREDVRDVDVQCSGDQMKEPPYQFVTIHLHYTVKGNLSPEKVAKAIQLSEDKYCSVLATLRPGVQLSSSYEVVP